MIAAGAAAVSIVAIAILAWRAATVSVPTPPARPVPQKVDAQPARPASVPDEPGKTQPPGASASSPPAPSAPSTGTQATPPSFDIVRVEPSGETVVAGRAAPGSTVTLMASGQPAASATADSAGQFVIIPPALKPGSHELTLSVGGGAGATSSSQSVAVAVPQRGQQEVIVALAEPDKATRILTDPAPSPNAPPQLAIRAVEAEQGGGFFASGLATPGAKLMVYLNDGHIAQVIADRLGQWSLRISRGMTPGRYTVRVDQIDETGKVAGRVEAPFAYAPQIAVTRTPGPSDAGEAARPGPKEEASAGQTPGGPPAPAAGAGGTTAATAASERSPPSASSDPASPTASPAPAAPTSPASVTIDQIATANVVRGDSLWRISRRVLGKGIRYTQIYDANTSQIRDPKRIYPGQILVVPMSEAAPKP